MVFCRMLTRRQSGGLVIAISMGVFSVGCFTNKSKEVAETGAAPPPSAYPTGANANPGSATPAPGGGASGPSSSTASTNVASSAPAPFQLREGEQLVPHVIVKGDSLSSIAGKYNSSIGRIMSANGMTDSKIFAGKTLQVPTSAPPANLAMNAASAPASAAGGGTYTGAPAAITPPGAVYPSAMAPPVLTAPSVPTVPGNPAATSYPREGTIAPPVQPAVSPTVPSFQGSRIQFGN